jgi:hypothetical protein
MRYLARANCNQHHWLKVPGFFGFFFVSRSRRHAHIVLVTRVYTLLTATIP